MTPRGSRRIAPGRGWIGRFSAFAGSGQPL